MTDKEKIRAEIERLYNQSLADENRQADRGLKRAAIASYGKSKACKELLSFIDSMQEEPVSEDLEKEMQHYFCKEWAGDPVVAARHFANWQKQKDEKALNENALLYNARLEGIEIGKAEMKQQMMKEAVEVEVWDEKPPHITYFPKNLKGGDKVKMIIIKID